MGERIDLARSVAYGVMRLPYELLKDELAFRHIGRLAVEQEAIQREQVKETE
jgi:hypothetical protein